MSRSKWKLKNFNLFLSKNFKIKLDSNINRNAQIIDALLDKNVGAYNGKIFKKIKITREKLGFTRTTYKKKIMK
jgi:ribosomal protein S19